MGKRRRSQRRIVVEFLLSCRNQALPVLVYWVVGMRLKISITVFRAGQGFLGLQIAQMCMHVTKDWRRESSITWLH